MSTGIVEHVRRNVIAYLALGAALVGVPTAWALAKNSVGAAQIKRNAVGKSEIRAQAVGTEEIEDGSLHSRDFATAELPTGPQGPEGPQGPSGPANLVNVTQTLPAFDATSTSDIAIALGNAPGTVLANSGPFSLVAKCFEYLPVGAAQSEVRAAVVVRTTQPGVITTDLSSLSKPPADGYLSPSTLDADAIAAEARAVSSSAKALMVESLSAIAPDGSSLIGELVLEAKQPTPAEGPFPQGPSCIFGASMGTGP